MYPIRATLRGWLIGLALMALVPHVAAAPAGSGVESTSPPRTWSGPPGMRLFGGGLQDTLSRDEAGPSVLTAMADGGYALAGSLPGPGGRQAWIARHDPQGLPVWTQILAGPFDLQVQALGSLPDGGLLLAGNLGPARPGFLMALDAAGETLWSRTLPVDEAHPGSTDHLLGLATGASGLGLAVGQTRRADGTQVGLLAAVPADGAPGWRLAVTEARSVQTLIRDGDGWLVAGASAAPAQAAWLARVDAMGRIDWQRTYGPAGGGAVTALVRLADGAVLLAGHPAEGGEVWLRRVDGRGEILAEQQPRLDGDGLPPVRSLFGLALAEDGGYWLGGETRSGDAWLARLDPAGETLWVRHYGGEGADRFTAFLSRPGGVLAAGLSASGPGPGAPGIWLATLDAQGDPGVSPPLSDRAARILALVRQGLGPESGLAAGGELEVREAADGTLQFWLPFARLDDTSDDAEGQGLELGTLALRASPPGTGTGPWRFQVEVPASLWLPGDGVGDAARLTLARRDLALELDPDSGLTTAIDLQLAGADLRLDPPDRLAGLYQGLGIGAETPPAGAEASALASLGLGELTLAVRLTPDAAGRWGGSLRFRLADLAGRDAQGQELGHLGGWRLEADYADMDLDTLDALSGRLEALRLQEPVQLLEEVGALVEAYLRASGQARGEWLLTDLAMPLEGVGDYLRLGELSLAGSVAPPLGQPLARDLRLQYHLKGLDLMAEGSQVAQEEARFEVAVERLALADLVEAIRFVLQNPAAGPAALPEWLPRILGGLEVTLATTGFRATLPGEAPLAIAGLKLHLALKGLDSPVPLLAFVYAQEGVSGLESVLPPWAPRTVNLDLALSGLPLAELLAVSLAEAPDPLAALALLGTRPIQLDIKDLKVDLPAGGLLLRGQALTQVPATPQALPEGSLTANIELRNLDALARLMDEAADPAERENLAALVAFLRLVGIERPDAEGGQLLTFALEANSRGEVVVNGKDLTPLLNNAASPGGGMSR